MGKKKNKKDKAKASSKKTCYFFTLPREIRDEIYSYIVSWPELPRSPVPLPQRFVKYRMIGSWPYRERDPVYVDLPLKMSTPAIMLANIQIFLEIREFLDARPLVLAPEYSLKTRYPALKPFMDYRDLLPPRTLRNVKWVKIVLDLNFHAEKAGAAKFLLQTISCLIRFWRKGHLLERLTLHTEYGPTEIKAWSQPYMDSDKTSHHQHVKELAKEVSRARRYYRVQSYGTDCE